MVAQARRRNGDLRVSGLDRDPPRIGEALACAAAGAIDQRLRGEQHVIGAQGVLGAAFAADFDQQGLVAPMFTRANMVGGIAAIGASAVILLTTG